MNKRYSRLIGVSSAAVAAGLAVASGPAGALDVYLAAKPFTKTLPDGSTVPMWGYVEDTGGTCYNATSDGDRLNCIGGLPAATAPGPRITVPPGQDLTIHLSNGLPDPTSVILAGQKMPTSTGGWPVWDDGTTGSRGGDLTKRVRSFGAEAAANGGREDYSWSLDRTGSFVYHSGTWPQEQVYMGLYGAMTRDYAADEVFDGVTYDNEVVLFYSDIDPELNARVAAGTNTTSIEYHARWFLVNGEPYVPDSTSDLSAGAPGDNTLLRFFSAAGENHVAVLQGGYMTLHAEDGLRYEWQDGANFGGYAPRIQYSTMIPPLQARDATVTLTDGRYALYDGDGNMTNPTSPDDYTTGDDVGGWLRFLTVSAP